MIVVLGSINTDIVTATETLPGPGETVLGPGYEMAAGGKGLNQAIAAARLKAPGGRPVTMVGAVGEDPLSSLPLKALGNSGVDTHFVRRTVLPTGCAFITVDRKGENQITVAQGANLGVEAADVPDTLLSAETTTICQMEIPGQEVTECLARTHAAGGRTILNIAPYASLEAETLASVDFLVANQVEALALAREHGIAANDPSSLVCNLAGLGADAMTVVLTLGSAGAIAFTDGKILNFPAPEIQPVDSTGAGDTFVGALAARLDEGADIEAALAFSVVAGALACLERGAAPSITDRSAAMAAMRLHE